MVKREAVVPGTLIQVVKLIPGQPGPRFLGRLGVNERLEVLSLPFSQGGMNLVRVKRLKTEEVFEAMYAFVTNFCKVPKAKKTKSPTPDPLGGT